MGNQDFLTVQDIAVRLQGREVLRNIAWRIHEREQWVILGPNGSGKSTLVKALWGGAPTHHGKIIYHFNNGSENPSAIRDSIGYVSFELQQTLMEHESWEQEIRHFSNRDDEVTTAKDIIISSVTNDGTLTIRQNNRLIRVADQLGITHLLRENITTLSTGESRKILIARALMKSPVLLILDEPFDGLDEQAREMLLNSINTLMELQIQVLLITHHLEEIPTRTTHALLIKNGSVVAQGQKSKILTSENIRALYNCELEIKQGNGRYYLSYPIRQQNDVNFRQQESSNISNVLIEMKNVSVIYGEKVVLDSFNWKVQKGENWAIIGPNGSGKSTILKLISGENLQGYANDITLFGRKKGTGETIWDIKQYIGIVSGELQLQYMQDMSAFDVVISGFYDSIGLYRYPTKAQQEVGEHWVHLLKIKGLADRNFHSLSYGQKRMILLARAIIKAPVLLILDEPCHGLDILNRKHVLETIERIGETDTQILYVSHHQEEILPCITHVLKLNNGMVVSAGKR